MPGYRNFILDKGKNGKSGVTFTKHRAVKLSAAEEVDIAVAATDFLYGIAHYDVTATDTTRGKKVSCATAGIVEWEAGAAIPAVGTEVTVDGSGRCIAAASTNLVHGINLQTAAGAGDRITVHLNLNGYKK